MPLRLPANRVPLPPMPSEVLVGAGLPGDPEYFDPSEAPQIQDFSRMAQPVKLQTNAGENICTGPRNRLRQVLATACISQRIIVVEAGFIETALLLCHCTKGAIDIDDLWQICDQIIYYYNNKHMSCLKKSSIYLYNYLLKAIDF